MKTLIVALYPYKGQGLDAWHDHGAGMTYMAAKNAGCDVSFLDMKALSNDEELRKAIKGYDLISFGLKSSYYGIGMKLVKFAKAQNSKVLVGGYHASAAPQELEENKFVDWIFRGESEITFPQFLKDPSKFNRTIVGEKPQNLDELPWIDRTIYRDPIENCGGWWHGVGFNKMLSVMAARGCPFQCGFCQPIENIHFGKKLRRRSVDSVIAELNWLKKTFKPQCIMIHDDTFFIQNNWLEEFIEKYPQIGLPFWAAARSSEICKYPELLNRLVKVGWNLVSVGFESGSQRILDRMKKGITVKENIESAKIIKKSGAKIYGNYMLGLPWEMKEDVQLTMSMADQIKAEMPSWAYFTPYPGCELGQYCIDAGWSLLDRYHYDRYPGGQKVKFVDYDYLMRVRRDGLREKLPKFLCDIIIPTYENEEVTVRCLESIKRFTHKDIYRVILVDNGSKHFSKVEATLQGMPHIYYRFKKNLGFTDAVNKGLEISTAPYLCLLNNDTRVTNNWLSKLIRHLESDEKLGLIGSLTGYHKRGQDSHHSLNLHKDLLPPEAREWDIDQINATLEEGYAGRTGNTAFVAFLCAVMPRKIYELAGPLDPNFKMGMWDDNDYNLTLRKLGYETKLALDTCIYHQGRTTFNLIEKTEKFDVMKLLRTNKAYLDKKWKAKPSHAPIQ